MLLYLLRGDPTFNMVLPVQNQLWQAQGGKEVVGPWHEIDFVPDKEDEFLAVDCLTMNTDTDGLLINNYARNILDPLLSSVGEFWPVRVLGQQYWWHNCIALVDALDQKKKVMLIGVALQVAGGLLSGSLQLGHFRLNKAGSSVRRFYSEFQSIPKGCCLPKPLCAMLSGTMG